MYIMMPAHYHFIKLGLRNHKGRLRQRGSPVRRCGAKRSGAGAPPPPIQGKAVSLVPQYTRKRNMFPFLCIGARLSIKKDRSL